MDFDKDLLARQQARSLAAQAEKAQHALSMMGQSKLDAIVEAVAKEFAREADSLAELAVEETRFGNATNTF